MANRNERIWFRATKEEEKEIVNLSKTFKSKSDFIRKCIFKKGLSMINPVEFIRVMDENNLEMKKIGNNINQIAKYVNQIKAIPNDNVQAEYNKHLAEYIIIHEKIILAYDKILNEIID